MRTGTSISVLISAAVGDLAPPRSLRAIGGLMAARANDGLVVSAFAVTGDDTSPLSYPGVPHGPARPVQCAVCRRLIAPLLSSCDACYDVALDRTDDDLDHAGREEE